MRDMAGAYNVADQGDTTQGMITTFLAKLIGCKFGYYSRTLSKLGDLQLVAEEANNYHLSPWLTICAEQGVDTQIVPFLEQENLDGSHICVSGKRILETGFCYEYPKLALELVRESILFMVQGRLLPNILNS